jgi:N-methylhydantoinase A
LNALTIAERLGCKRLIIPEVGAVLSAYGAIVSDIGREYRRVFVTSSAQFDRDGAASVIADLRERAAAFANGAGAAAGDVRVDFLVEARYVHQVWEIDVAIEPDLLLAPGGLDLLRQNFHRAHEDVFAFSDPHSPIEVIAWRIAVHCKMLPYAQLKLVHATAPVKEPKRRRAFFLNSGWLDVPVLTFAEIRPDVRIEGPAIVESPFTSIVINPDGAFSRSKNGNLVVVPGSTRTSRDKAYVTRG